MRGFFWPVVCAGYWLWAAKGRCGAAQGFLHGLFLGLLCFGVLPPAMETPLFYGTAVCALCGVAGAVWLERKGRAFPFAALLFTALTIYWLAGETANFPCIVAFFGGSGLYVACGGVLPEGLAQRETIRAALGGCAGFLLSVCFFAMEGIL